MENSQLQIFKQSIASVTDADALVAALQTERQTSIRINPKKMGAPALPRIPWNQYGFYLENRPLFTLDPLFHAGAYYVQEASSMFLEQIISPLATRPLKVLDVCAAPGGKSTLTISLLPEGSLFVIAGGGKLNPADCDTAAFSDIFIGLEPPPCKKTPYAEVKELLF